jgi:hypothetical protein
VQSFPEVPHENFVGDFNVKAGTEDIFKLGLE